MITLSDTRLKEMVDEVEYLAKAIRPPFPVRDGDGRVSLYPASEFVRRVEGSGWQYLYRR